MKRIILKVTFCVQIIFLANRLSAQDIIVLKNGDEIKSKVTEVEPDHVKYKKWDNQEGPSYTANKSDIFMIKYQNGTKDVFKVQETPVKNNDPVPNESINKIAAVTSLENYLKNKISGKVLHLQDFRKTNGIMKNTFGQESYEIYFDIDVQFIADGWQKGNGLEGYWNSNFSVYASPPDLHASGEYLMYESRHYPIGTLMTFSCVADLIKSDNGFVIESLDLKKVINNGTTAPSNKTSIKINPINSSIEINGIAYKIVTLGTQTWMIENLKTRKYNDGTDIPFVTDDLDWTSLYTAGCCVYNNDDKYKESYGILYNWQAVNTGKLCPIGWHVPTDNEWKTLNNLLGDEYNGGAKLKEIGTSHWISPNIGATNETGFTAYPGGYRSNTDGSFNNLGHIGYWWSATASGSTSSWYRSIRNDFKNLGRYDNFHNESGLSVRCIKNN